MNIIKTNSITGSDSTVVSVVELYPRVFGIHSPKMRSLYELLAVCETQMIIVLALIQFSKILFKRAKIISTNELSD